MNWTESIAKILSFRLFELEGRDFTPLQLLIFVLVLLATWAFARSVRRLLTERLMVQVEAAPRHAIARLLHHTIWGVGLLVGLRVLGLDLTTVTVLGGALGVGIGFGLQNSVANVFAGFILLVDRTIKVGDRVTVENIEGNVAEINFRSTTLVTNDNVAMIVPNSEFINRPVINWSYGDPKIRIHIPVSVAYGSDLERVRRTLLEVAAGTAGLLPDPEPMVRFREFGDSSLNLELLVWGDQPALHRRVRSQLNFAIDAAFRREQIEIPFPQRDLHVRSVAGQPKPMESIPVQ